MSDGGFVDADHGWALVPDALLTTQDGGATWGEVTPPAAAAERIVGAVFADSLHGWLASETHPAQGASGQLVVNVHRTEDGGTTWTTVRLASIDSPGPDPTLGFPSFSVLSADRAFIMLALPNAPGTVSRLYVTVDGGRTWDRRAGVTEASSVAFLDATHGWSIRNDTVELVRTTDGGRSWVRARLPAVKGVEASQLYPGLPVRDPGGGLVLFESAAMDGAMGVILTSADDGATWSIVERAPGGQSGPVMVTVDGSWLLGGRAPVLSTDRGATWTPIPGATRGIAAISTHDGIHLSTVVAGSDGCGPTIDCFVPSELWFSDDSGRSWRDATP